MNRERTTQREPKMTDDYREALEQQADRWVAACGGFEEPFTHNGARWLYVWNPATGDHGYLNLDTDIVHEDWHPGSPRA